MTPPAWRYVSHGRDPVNRGAAWIFQTDDGLAVAVPWNWRNMRTLGEAESFLNTYVRILEDRPPPLTTVPMFRQPAIAWHPSEGPAVATDQADRRPKVV